MIAHDLLASVRTYVRVFPMYLRASVASWDEKRRFVSILDGLGLLSFQVSREPPNIYTVPLCRSGTWHVKLEKASIVRRCSHLVLSWPKLRLLSGRISVSLALGYKPRLDL